MRTGFRSNTVCMEQKYIDRSWASNLCFSHQKRYACREGMSAGGVARDPHNLCGTHGGMVTPSNTKTHPNRAVIKFLIDYLSL